MDYTTITTKNMHMFPKNIFVHPTWSKLGGRNSIKTIINTTEATTTTTTAATNESGLPVGVIVAESNRWELDIIVIHNLNVNVGEGVEVGADTTDGLVAK